MPECILILNVCSLNKYKAQSRNFLVCRIRTVLLVGTLLTILRFAMNYVPLVLASIMVCSLHTGEFNIIIYVESLFVS